MTIRKLNKKVKRLENKIFVIKCYAEEQLEHAKAHKNGDPYSKECKVTEKEHYYLGVDLLEMIGIPVKKGLS